MITRQLGWLTLWLVGTDLFVVSPLLPDVRHSLSVSTSAAGWTVTAFALAYLLGGPSLGALADRIGHRRVLGAALVVFAAANLLTGLATSLVTLLIARAFAGLAASGTTPSVYALIGASAPPTRRASWLAVVTSGLLLALATGAPVGSVLAAVLGWHGVFFLLAAALTVLALITVMTWVRHPGPGPAQPVGALAARPDAKATDAGLLVRLRAVSVTGLWALALYGLYTYLGTILTDALHFTPPLIAAALFCYGISAIVGNLAGGWLTDHHSGRRVSLLSLLALAIAEAVFALALHAPAGVLLVVLAVVALVAYPYFCAQQARLISRFTITSGSLLAWNNSAMYAGILLASILGGPLLNGYGGQAVAYSASGTAILAAAAATRSISPTTASKRRCWATRAPRPDRGSAVDTHPVARHRSRTS
jgi:predicted MFS family arabinose efflux permease